ncbi:hypothetical protein BJX61DRAFT_24268 [Aspergillus egyptiacus]|nr:hypothetical protein BJX61DRAFT_24268 [Aspergillus egyptiacus]
MKTYLMPGLQLTADGQLPTLAGSRWSTEEKKRLWDTRAFYDELDWDEFYALRLFPGRSLEALKRTYNRIKESDEFYGTGKAHTVDDGKRSSSSSLWSMESLDLEMAGEEVSEPSGRHDKDVEPAADSDTNDEDGDIQVDGRPRALRVRSSRLTDQSQTAYFSLRASLKAKSNLRVTTSTSPTGYAAPKHRRRTRTIETENSHATPPHIQQNSVEGPHTGASRYLEQYSQTFKLMHARNNDLSERLEQLETESQLLRKELAVQRSEIDELKMEHERDSQRIAQLERFCQQFNNIAWPGT